MRKLLHIVTHAFTITLLYVKLFFSVQVKVNVGFTAKQNCQKFGLFYSILKQTFKYSRELAIFRDFKVSRDRDITALVIRHVFRQEISVLVNIEILVSESMFNNHISGLKIISSLCRIMLETYGNKN